ncbi:ABC transporter ATP-binding protein [Methanocaldococcus infernus]
MIEIKNLSYKYKDFEVKNISFNLNYGETLTLLGPNGAGKSTILKVIYGLLKPNYACVFIDGMDFHKLPVKERAKIMSLVPQSHSPVFPYKVIDFVVMGVSSQLSLFESPKKEHYKKALNVLKMLGIEHLKDKTYTELSGGQLQLVLIARALVQEPKVLLLDEPISHLDFKNQVLILDILQELAKNKKLAIIMTLHDPNFAALYSDKIAFIKDGSLLDFGEVSEVFKDEVLEKVYDLPISLINIRDLKIVLPKKFIMKNHDKFNL